jgi:integrase
MRKTLTDKGVAALKPRAHKYAFPDPQLTGHYVLVQPTGSKSFTTVARANGKQVWTHIGAADAMSIADAREQARAILQRVRAGLPAVEAKGETFASVAANWLKRVVDANEHRSRKEVRRLLDVHVLPVWGEREFLSIRRSDVAALLDEVEDDSGKRQADAVLGVVRAIMNWYATRSDDYVPVVVRGMARRPRGSLTRSRIFSDDETRAFWVAAESAGTFGAFAQFSLLTAQRKSKVQRMRWSEITGNEWTIPKEPREKGNAGVLVLPDLAMRIIEAQSRLGGNPYVFAGRSDGPIVGMSKFKKRLDQTSGVTGWRLHDLRRTARSLMARAGVSSDHAERVMGHAIVGVEGVYDRHSYKSEKAAALAKLATLINGIVRPRDNVTPLVAKRPKRQ